MSKQRNPNIKKPNTEVQMTHAEVMELKRCAQDPVYFIKKYVKIQHPTKGAINFKLYPYQEKMIRAYEQNRYTVVLSARQTGKSTVAAAYLLWYGMFNFDKTILIASNKNSNAMEMIYRIRYAYENIPLWLKPGVLDDGWNKHNIGFDNGSRIVSEATSDQSGRGLAISLLYLDEFAFVAPAVQDEFWTSISPTLATGGSCIMTSTPNGDIDIFAQIWRGAQVKSNSFYPVRVRWDEPPGRDEKFKQNEIGQIGERKWDQEYECQFLSSEALLIDTVFLTNLTKQIEQIKPVGEINDVIFWDAIKKGHTYLLGVDPATGSGEDYSVITLFEFPSMDQVAEYRSNTMSTNELYKTLKNLLLLLEKYQTTTYFSVENNGVGEGVIALYEADEDVPETAQFISEVGKKRLGMTTTSKTKMKACVNLREMIKKGDFNLKSPIFLAELKTYARCRGSYAAQTGSTDDCIAASLVVIRLLQEVATFEQTAFDKLYSGDFERWNTDDWDGFDGEYDDGAEADPFIM